MSLYDDLGVPPDASQRDITSAYRKAAKNHHPDTGGDPEDFARINRAAVILRDPDRRARYDRDGTVDDQPDRAQSIATEILVGAFRQALGGGDHEITDIIGAARKAIEDRRSKLGQQKAEGGKAKRKIEAALKRLKHKGKSANILGGLLQQDLDTFTRAIAQIEQEMEACKAAIAMAADYAWEFEPAPPEARRRSEWGRPTASMDGFYEIDLAEVLRGRRQQKGLWND